jgi:hypothetical protein
VSGRCYQLHKTGFDRGEHRDELSDEPGASERELLQHRRQIVSIREEAPGRMGKSSFLQLCQLFISVILDDNSPSINIQYRIKNDRSLTKLRICLLVDELAQQLPICL